jgi:polysaccharide deacetylase 2 family uncharacterized protein YibQ
MGTKKQRARRKKKPARSRPSGRGASSAGWAWIGGLRGGAALFAIGIALGLGIGIAVTALVPDLLQAPRRHADVAQAPVNMQQAPKIKDQTKSPDVVEKAAPPPQAPPALPPVPMEAQLPAVAEEGAHQSASVTAPPPDLPANDQVAGLTGPETKEPRPPQWLANSVAVRDPGNRPMISIVLDDVGVARQHAEMALALPAPIVLSIMTYAENAGALARKAQEMGHEIMVHMPMQPMNPAINPGPNALDVGMEAAELRRRIAWGLGRLDGYVGFNNHMGSRFTQDADGMRIVLDEAKHRGLLFLDSKTIAGSLGDRLAAQMGVTHIARDVFLDDDMSEAAVARQLAEAEAIARKKGYAVAIGHPHPATIAVLLRWLPEAQARGIAIVPLTTIVKKREGVAG